MFDERRFGLITGSKCVVLFPKRSAEKGQKTYARLLAKQKFFKYDDEVTTWQTEHGHLAESSAFEYYQQYFCKDAEYQPPFEMYSEYGGSADCIAPDWGVDFKCPTSLDIWLEYLYDGIDDQQYHQAQMYMWLYDRPEWHICSFLLETNKMSENGRVYPVDYKHRMIINKVKKDKNWFENLLEKGEPVIELRDFHYNILKQEFTK